jgi:hypothetical protein
MKTFEIYFNDLTREAQERLCREFETNSADENWEIDVFPLAIIHKEEYNKNWIKEKE